MKLGKVFRPWAGVEMSLDAARLGACATKWHPGALGEFRSTLMQDEVLRVLYVEDNPVDLELVIRMMSLDAARKSARATKWHLGCS